MKPPLIDLRDEATNEAVSLPAVSVVMAHGFVSLAVPVARIVRVPGRCWRAMILLSYEDRERVHRDRAHATGRTASTLSPDNATLCVDTGNDVFMAAPNVRPNGGASAWYNAEAHWVDASWLVDVLNKTTELSNGARLVLACARLALDACGGAQGEIKARGSRGRKAHA